MRKAICPVDAPFNYYQSQLDRIKLSPDGYFPTVVISCEVDKTKHLDINLESIPELRKFLDRVELELKRRDSIKLSGKNEIIKTNGSKINE